MHRNYDRAIRLIYDGTSDPAAWSRAFVHVADHLDAAGVGFGIQDMRTHQFWNVAEQGIDPSLDNVYRQHAPENKIWRTIKETRAAKTDTMVMPKPEFKRTSLYGEWFAPQRFHSVMAAPVLVDGDRSGVVVAFRSVRRGNFEKSDLTALVNLSHHFSTALRLHLERQDLEQRLAASNDLLDRLNDGVIGLDANLRVCQTNPAADRIVAAGDGLVLRNAQLSCRNAGDEHTFQRTLRAAAPISARPVSGYAVVHRADRKPLLVRVVPFPDRTPRWQDSGAAMTLLIKDPEQKRPLDLDLLRRLLDATPAEASAVAALISRKQDGHAAAFLGVSKNTVRKHMSNLREKLDLHSEGDILRLVASFGLSIAPDEKSADLISRDNGDARRTGF